MGAVAALHPVTQSAVLFHAWRLLGPDGKDFSVAHDGEAAVMAARHGAAMARMAAAGQGAPFLPLALTGPSALRATGPAIGKLSAWISGSGQASLAALLHLDRIGNWERRAREATHDLTGRTPGRLIEVFAAWPMVSAPLAEAETDVSRAAVQRNLDTLTERGLVREVTGQGRYRVWTAAV